VDRGVTRAFSRMIYIHLIMEKISIGFSTVSKFFKIKKDWHFIATRFGVEKWQDTDE